MTEYRTMNQRATGLYRILERPRIYERFQKLLGAEHARRRFVHDFLRPFAGARLLDVGCGPGSLLEDLPADVDYTGFDINPKYIEAARNRNPERGRFFCSGVGAETPALGDEKFDFVVAKGLLHHLDDVDAQAFVRSTRRYLRDDGVFVSYDAVFHEGQRPLARFLAALDRGANVRTPEAYSALVASAFSDVETHLVTNLARIPYDHFIVRARSPRP
jgi:SAM-dependent methyltransferase